MIARAVNQTPDPVPGRATPDAESERVTGAPECPKCGGRMWDNRTSKRNPRAPDFRCRDRRCEGVLWPGQHHAAVPIVTRPLARVGAAPDRTPRAHSSDAAPRGAPPTDRSGPRQSDETSALGALRRCYIAVTEFVLSEVRTRYDSAGVPCDADTIAAITATVFIAECRRNQPSRSSDDGRDGQ